MAGLLRFTVRRTVKAPIGSIWQVLGDCGTEHRWLKQLDHCARHTDIVRVGTVRSCILLKALMGRTEVREALTEYAPGASLAYALEGAAGPFSSAASRWSTVPASAASTILTVEGLFTAHNRLARLLNWPLAKPMLRRLTRKVMGELEVFVTRGAAPVSVGREGRESRTSITTLWQGGLVLEKHQSRRGRRACRDHQREESGQSMVTSARPLLV